MIKFVWLLFCLIAFQHAVRCESQLSSAESITTVQPNYSVNQVDDDGSSSVDLVAGKSIELNQKVVPLEIASQQPVVVEDEILIRSNEPKIVNEVVRKATEIKQVHIDDQLNVNAEMAATVLPELEATTIQTVNRRMKRAPQYTVRELMAPNGVMHEVGHLRDHAVEMVARRLSRSRFPRVRNAAARVARVNKARTEIHHKYHHIPNHLAYLPVVGPLLDENRDKTAKVSQVGKSPPDEPTRSGRNRRGILFPSPFRPGLFRSPFRGGVFRSPFRRGLFRSPFRRRLFRSPFRRRLFRSPFMRFRRFFN